jgi:hypothetical protein
MEAAELSRPADLPESGLGEVPRRLAGLNQQLASRRHDARLLLLSEDLSACLTVERSPL